MKGGDVGSREIPMASSKSQVVHVEGWIFTRREAWLANEKLEKGGGGL